MRVVVKYLFFFELQGRHPVETRAAAHLTKLNVISGAAVAPTSHGRTAAPMRLVVVMASLLIILEDVAAEITDYGDVNFDSPEIGEILVKFIKVHLDEASSARGRVAT
ncbi:unnamed protein product [Caenorhabditis auriculariae]|uniref:Uncharacterized protein n=1 Tax=Caenorhabditis auriculariae TaxID=2777116 RepID=A0A8S1HGA5_9PELO|nr:unnamed protein product [Caenorhabditis auriculariae]